MTNAMAQRFAVRQATPTRCRPACGERMGTLLRRSLLPTPLAPVVWDRLRDQWLLDILAEARALVTVDARGVLPALDEVAACMTARLTGQEVTGRLKAAARAAWEAAWAADAAADEAAAWAADAAAADRLINALFVRWDAALAAEGR